MGGEVGGAAGGEPGSTLLAVRRAVAETSEAAEHVQMQAVEAAADSVGRHWAQVHIV